MGQEEEEEEEEGEEDAEAAVVDAKIRALAGDVSVRKVSSGSFTAPPRQTVRLQDVSVCG